MAEKVIIELDVDSDEAVKGLDKVNNSVEDIQKTTSKSETGLKKFGTTLKNLGKGAALIGLISAAFGLLQEALQNNQKVMDVVNNVFTSFGIIANDLFNFVTDDLAPALASVFEAPQKALEAVKTGIQDFVDRQLKLLFDGLGLFGKAFDKLLSGDIKGALMDAGEGFVEIQRAINPLVIVTEAAVKGTIAASEAIVDYATDTYNAADAITEQTKSLRLLELQQTRIREQYDRDAENLRQVRDDTTKTIEERIEANRKLGEVLDEQQKLEQKTVTDRIAALQNQQKELGVTQERIEEIYELETELIAIEAQQAGFRSEQLTNENALLQEQADLKSASIEREKQEEKELSDFITDLDKKNEKEQQDASKKTIALEQKTRDAKIQAASDVLNVVSSFAEEGSDLAKGAAIAQATIDTYKGATAAFSAVAGIPVIGPALGAAAAAAAVAAGIANVRSILSVNTNPKNKSGSVNPSVPTAPTQAAIEAPDFSIAGDDGQSQLADAVSSAQNEPTRAYVVSSDIDNANAFDRQTERGATFG